MLQLTPALALVDYAPPPFSLSSVQDIYITECDGERSLPHSPHACTYNFDSDRLTSIGIATELTFASIRLPLVRARSQNPFETRHREW